MRFGHIGAAGPSCPALIGEEWEEAIEGGLKSQI